MSLTLEELKERMKSRVDEISILELLDISAEDLVERFQDKIEEKYESLLVEVEDGIQEEEY